MRNCFIRITSFFGALLLLTQCVPTNLQTARTLPEGEFAYGFTSNFTYINAEADPENIAPLVTPEVGVTARYGLGDNLDAGFTTGVLTLTALDVKYRYAGTNESPFAASTGLTLGFGGAFILQSNNVASYFFNDRFALTSSLRPGMIIGGSGFTPTGNTTLGFRTGGKWGFFMEGGIYAVGDDWDVSPSLGIGFIRGL